MVLVSSLFPGEQSALEEGQRAITNLRRHETILHLSTAVTLVGWSAEATGEDLSAVRQGLSLALQSVLPDD
jgi:hypothetical protein